MTDPVSPDVRARLRALTAWFAPREAVAISFSGGVDSALLLTAAVNVLGDRAVGFIAVSPALGVGELERARRLAAEIGARLVEVATDELGDERYRRNAPDRCFHCRMHMYRGVAEEAARLGITTLLDGTNRDDVGDYRPGRRAADQRGVRSPLLEVGFTKAQVRAAARALGLSAWDKPAMPCLASRVPYHTVVTAEKLAQVEAAESVLHREGFPVCRVRHYGAEARIEVPAGRLSELRDEAGWARIVRALRAIGFAEVTVDTDGFRSGKLNDALQTVK